MMTSLKITALVSKLTAEPVSFLKLYTVVLLSFARKLFPSFHTTFRVAFLWKGRHFSIGISDMADIAAVYEVFIKKEYELAPLDAISASEKVKTIIDLGSNIGVTALYLSLTYPNAIIYAVEANPHVFARLQKNVEGFKNIRPIFGAIAPENGTLSFFVNKSSLSSSIFRRAGTAEEVQVQAFSLKELMKNNGIQAIDILKFDIEGAEYGLFDASAEEICTAGVIVGEVHPDIAGRDGREMVDRIKGFSVERIPTHGERFIVRAYRNN